MKKQILIAVSLGGLLYMLSGFAWAANNLPLEQENTRIQDSLQIPGVQPVTQQNRTGNEVKIRNDTTNTGKAQGPAPVILRIKLVNKTVDKPACLDQGNDC
jgi:hypothetical protein